MPFPGLLPVKNDSIILPDGSMRSVEETQAARAVSEYDPDLMLGRSRENGEWVVFQRVNDQPYPVLGLGFQLPSPERIKERLYKSDTKRHGGALARGVEKRNQARRAAIRKQADDAGGAAAEAFEWGERQLNPSVRPKIFVPGDRS